MKVSISLLLIFALFLLLPITAETCRADNVDDVIEKRLRQAIEYAMEHPWPDKKKQSPSYALACLFTNQHVELANKLINDHCEKYPAKPVASYGHAPQVLLRIYLKPRCYALLTDKSRRNIEKMAWNYMYARSRIDPAANSWNNATRGPWFITGSENHDMNFKVAILLASQILRQAPAPYGPAAKLADGFSVEEHYHQWIKYFKSHFRQRAREGLDCEIAHPSSYGLSTIIDWYRVADLTDDPELKRLAENLLTLFWTNVAVEYEPRTGIRAGWSVTRGYKYSWYQIGAIYWAKQLLYAYDWTDKVFNGAMTDMCLYTSSYRVPPIVRAIARDTNRGPYMVTARRFGRGGRWIPTPAEGGGVYEVVFDDGPEHNSHLRRDTWYTPQYALSAITFDPARSYIELTRQSRLMGVTFSSDIEDRIIVLGRGSEEYKMVTSCTINGLCRPDLLIVARDVGAVLSKDLPDMTYYKGMSYDEELLKINGTRVFISDGALWDNRQEKDDGWFFTHSANAYCALKIAQGDYKVVPSSYKFGYFLELQDLWAPVLIQTGRAQDYKDGFEQFKKAVKATPYSYTDGKLTYTSLAGEKYEYFSNSRKIPTVNGKTFNLNPPRTYNSPYLSMDHGSDIATISYPGHDDLKLDFSYDK